MTEQLAELIWLSLGAYLCVGLCIALPTLLFGLRRLEAGAAKMPLRVRLLIAPGLIALWPLVLVRIFGLRAKEDRP
ncbi:MAG: hypothetical protein K2P70_10565 [Hyphomonadaceae bacterium]|nr:hypothetical protein [Hyphomonadaceae bacterium]